MTYEFVKFLLVQLGDNAGLREPVFESILAATVEEQSPSTETMEPVSYLELLERVDEFRFSAMEERKYRTATALKGLRRHVRMTLNESAIRIHKALSGKTSGVTEKDIRRIGIEIDNFPTGFPNSIDLLALTLKLVRLEKDIRVLRSDFGASASGLIRHLESKWSDLSTGLQDLAREALGIYIQKLEPNSYTDDLRRYHLEDDISESDRGAILDSLARSKEFRCLTALCNMDLAPNQHDLFLTLMYLRFGDQGLQTPEQWRAWLKGTINKVTNREAAIKVWLDTPALFKAFFDGLPVPLSPEQLDENGGRPAIWKAILERHRSILGPDEIRFLTRAIYEYRAPEVELSGQSGRRSMETIGEFLVDTVMDEDPAGAMLESGLEAIGASLTVTIPRVEVKAPVSRPRNEPATPPWIRQLASFFTRNLVFVLAPSSIFIGLLLLVFTLWDKAVWIRYGLSPLMILVVAYALSRIGRWLISQEPGAEIPVVVMQGVTIFLAPLSLLFVAMLSVDRELSLIVRYIWVFLLSAGLLASWRHIFISAIECVHAGAARIHAYTLLLLNSLLLLLPIVHLMNPEDVEAGFSAASRGMLVAGFYVCFAAMIVSMRRMRGRLQKSVALGAKAPFIFYVVSCLGTYGVIWGLVHVKLGLLPAPYTYGPLMVLVSFMLMTVEIAIVEDDDRLERVGALSYAAYFFMLIGILLSINHPVVRVATLLATGAAWLYQSLVLRSERHFTIAWVILSLAISAIALPGGLSPYYFPFLALLVAVTLLGVSKFTSIPEMAVTAERYGPIYLSLAFAGSIVWQAAVRYPAAPLGAAFVLYGLYYLYLGAVKNRLIHVHAGMGCLIAALPYLGFADMNTFALSDNTLVFGFALLGLIWLAVCRLLDFPAIRDSRSTILWNLGIMALCFMIVRQFVQDESAVSIHAAPVVANLLGQTVMCLLMLLAGYFSRSRLPVWVAIAMAGFTFMEIKDRFDIVMYSGLASATSACLLMLLAEALRRWNVLENLGQGDLIWRKTSFPYPANDHRLFTTPLLYSALLLFASVLLWRFPQNLFDADRRFLVKTSLAVMISGTALCAYSLWFEHYWPAVVGFIAIGLGVFHAGLSLGAPLHLAPIFFLLVLICWEVVDRAASAVFPNRPTELISETNRTMALVFCVVLALSVYPVYSFLERGYGWWAPLGLSIAVLLTVRAWQTNHKDLFIPVFLVVWQLVVLFFSGGAALWAVFLPASGFYPASAVMTLAVAALFFVFEKRLDREKYDLVSILLWPAVLLFLVIGNLLAGDMLFGYIHTYQGFIFPRGQLILWGLAGLVLGRYLHWSFLWLVSLFLIYTAALPGSDPVTRIHFFSHPAALTVLAAVLAGLTIVTREYPEGGFVYYNWYDKHYSRSRANSNRLRPQMLFAVVSQIVVFLIISIVFFTRVYPLNGLAVLCLFLAVFPALPSAPVMGISRRLLAGIQITLACIGLMLWVRQYLPNLHPDPRFAALVPIGLGLLIALAISLEVDRRCPDEERTYNALKYVVCAALLLLSSVALFFRADIQNPDATALATLSALVLASGLFFRYRLKEHFGLLAYVPFIIGISEVLLAWGWLLCTAVFRQPLNESTAGWVMLLPAAWFFIRSEMRRYKSRPFAPASQTAMIWALLWVAFYLLSGWLFFPQHIYEARLFLYQVYAPAALACGLVLIRLHAHGRGLPVVLSGLAATTIALFFLVTAIPLLSPVSYLERAALSAVVLGAAIIFSLRRAGLVIDGLTRLGRLDEDVWATIRRYDAAFILAGCHGLLAAALFDPHERELTGPLIAASACLWFYCGHCYRKTWFIHIGFIGLSFSLYSSRLFGAFGPNPMSIWAFLAWFILLIPLHDQYLKRRFDSPGVVYIPWAILTSLFVLVEYFFSFGPGPNSGLLALAILWAALFFIPMSDNGEQSLLKKVGMGALPYGPVLLLALYFGAAAKDRLPLIILVMVVFSCLLQYYQARLFFRAENRIVNGGRAVHQFLFFLSQPHTAYPLAVQGAATILVLSIHILDYSGVASPNGNFYTMVLLQSILFVYWLYQAQLRRFWLWTIAAEAAVCGLILTLRSGLPVKWGITWSETWDISTGLFLAFAITALRPWLQRADRAVGMPIRFTLFGLPLATILYAYNFDIGFDVLSRVILLYSVLFTWKAYSEKDRFMLAYAFLGFNAFLVMMFMNHNLKSPQAYVTPAALSVLILVQVFRDMTSRLTANAIRSAALLALLGTAVFQTLVHNQLSPLSHLILIGLSCGVMAAAVFFRIRVFALAGLGCFFLDVMAILYIVISLQGADTIKVVLGVVLTLLGSLILTGYVMYRKHKEFVINYVERTRAVFYSWE